MDRFRTRACIVLLSMLGGGMRSEPADAAIGIRITEVVHAPDQPRSGEGVVVTVRASSSNELDRVLLQVRVVEPGRYIRRTDAEYQRNWREFPMADDGRGADRSAKDGVFTATVPGELQTHRNLVRYHVTASTRQGVTVRWPAATNACPNFAWFVYDGVPAWKGASRPGSAKAWTFSSEFLATLPIYHLIARSGDVERSQWNHEFNRRPFLGTLVYEGRVYDHIQFHNRGQASTYLAGKNKWGFRFVPGQEFEARDFWGRRYAHAWTSFNLNACASPWAQVNRGMAGLDEAVSYRAYQLAGVPSPDAYWVHFRVIDAVEEAAATDQYEGDLWGLYLVVQEKNGTWLRERGLPDGNIYSAESGPKHLARGLPRDGSDLLAFQGGINRRRPEAWWRTHLDLEAYYSFHALNRVLANIDLRPDGNHYMYHRPEGRWVALPHDLDMMFIPKTHWPGTIDATQCLAVPALRIEYANRAREVLDLFCSDRSPAGGQIGQLVAEMARVLAPTGHPRTWAELDEAMWNWHPHSNQSGQFNRTPFRDHRMGGGWMRTLTSPDFAGFCEYIINFCTDSRPTKNYRPNDGDQRGYGFGFLHQEASDAQIPDRPTIEYRGGPAYAADELVFGVTAFSSPDSHAFASIQWRVAEISAPGIRGDSAGQPWRYEVEPGWTSGDLKTEAKEFRVGAGVCRGGASYRVRARYRDSTGRCSHWSAPILFTVAVAEPAGRDR